MDLLFSNTVNVRTVRQKLSGFGKIRLTGLYWSLC